MSHSNKALQRLRILMILFIGLILGYGIIVAAPAVAATKQPTAQITGRPCTVVNGIGQKTLDIKLVNSSSQSNRFWVKTELHNALAIAKYYDLAPGKKLTLKPITYPATTEHNQYGVRIAVYLDSDPSNALDDVTFLPWDCSPPPELKFPPISYANANKLAVVKININYVVNINVVNINDGVVAHTETFPDDMVNQAKTITLSLGQGEYQIEGFGILQDFSETFTVTAPAPKARVTDPRHGLVELNTQWAARNVIYWEDGTKKKGKWTYGKNRYVTKTGTDGIYTINTPNVGNGKGKISENRVRVTVQYMVLGADLLWKKFGDPIKKTLSIRER